MEKKRILGLDVVRCVAIIFVFCVHFFLNTDFYSLTVRGGKIFFLFNLRWLFFCCVPLFLILTGYLNNKKKLEKKYYKGLIKIFISYVFIETVIFIFQKYYLHFDISLFRYTISIFGFNTGDYSWYVEMYIGLFLMIPFLNIIYNNLNNRKSKKSLIGTMLVLTAFPSFLSNLKYDINIFPDWWVNIYPITYYFIGCYIFEYHPKVSKKILVVGIIVGLILQSSLTYFNCYGEIFNWTFLGSYGAITVTIISVFIFLLLYDLDFKNIYLAKLIEKVSVLSFDMYLFSYISDRLIYNCFKINSTLHDVKMFFAVILCVTILSFLFSYMKELIFACIKKIFSKNKKE